MSSSLFFDAFVFAMALNTVCCQVDSCGSEFIMFLPYPFNASRFQCRPVWKSFVLRYSKNQDSTLSIVLSAKYTSGWVGIGFSNDGMMIGSSAMVGWIDETGKANAKQYYLGGRSSSEVIVKKVQLLETGIAPAVILYGDNIHLTFQLKFSASLSKQSLLFASSSAPPINYHLTEHDERISLSLDFSAGTTASSSYPYNQKRNHGLLAIFGWGVLLPVGTIIARYCRNWDPLWYYLHVAFQFVGFIVGIAGVVSGIALYNRSHYDVLVHKAMGVTVLILTCLQVTAFFLRPDEDSKVRKCWNWFHQWIGRLALFLAAVNISLGIEVGDTGSSWKMGYGAILAFSLIAVVILETMLWTRLSPKIIALPDL